MQADQIQKQFLKRTTVNVDIFACINFRGIMKMGNFARIKIRILSITGSIGYHKSYFRSIYIFADTYETQKYIHREHFYAHTNLNIAEHKVTERSCKFVISRPPAGWSRFRKEVTSGSTSGESIGEI